MKKTISIIFIVILTLLCFSSCADKKAESVSLNIVCTAFPQYDFVRNIIGSEDGLTMLLDDGADLHSYEPTAQDIIAIGNADIFIYGGGISDKWVDSALKSANNPDLKVIAMMDSVNTLKEEYVVGMQHEEHESHYAHTGDHSEEDEHIWLSLKNAIKITNTLCNAICNADVANTEKYRLNTENYISQLNALNSEYQTVVESAKRNVLLFADRFPFRYLTEDYNITYYAAFAGCSSESEASFQTMAGLIDKTKELSLPVVLTIEGSDGSLAKTVCDATGAKTAVLNSCQSVSIADAKNGTDYIDIMKSNLEVIREALN